MKQANTLVSVLVVIVVAVLGFGLMYYLLVAPNQVNVIEEPTPTPTESDVTVSETPTGTVKVTTTATVSKTVAPTSSITTTPIAEVTPPADWKLIDTMSFLPYTVYRPNGWWFRYFSPATLGLDPNQLPVASEYVGKLSISQLQSSSSWNTDYIGQLESGYSQISQVIDSNSWLVLEGKFKDNELSTGNYTKLGYVKIGSKEYVVQLIGSNNNYDGNESKFDIMISTLKFK